MAESDKPTRPGFTGMSYLEQVRYWRPFVKEAIAGEGSPSTQTKGAPAYGPTNSIVPATTSIVTLAGDTSPLQSTAGAPRPDRCATPEQSRTSISTPVGVPAPAITHLKRLATDPAEYAPLVQKPKLKQPLTKNGSASKGSRTPTQSLELSDRVPSPITASRPAVASGSKSLQQAPVPQRTTPKPPAWYEKTKLPTARARGKPSVVDVDLQVIGDGARRCKELFAQNNKVDLSMRFTSIADAIHKAMFHQVDRKILRQRRLLHNDSGLPQLFAQEFSGGVDYPFYIKADAEELYNKWCREIFETDLLRGIKVGKKKSMVNIEASSDKLDPEYPGRVKGTFHGDRHLVNGQWFPNQLCAVRDGAHNSAQGGISGNAKSGAWSIIVAGNSTYPDIDEGHNLQYCGTDSKDGEPTEATKFLLTNIETKQPVRVIRSCRCKNARYRPAGGYRYDGLYDVMSSEILDPSTQRYRFMLVRRGYQDPIRASGPEVRPTLQEMQEYRKIQDSRVYLVE